MLYRLYLDPAGLSIVDMWPDGGVAVRSVNDTAHVAPT
jgi:ribonuclease H / adenosylcobalamin/alpha-ribazole phosphatase